MIDQSTWFSNVPFYEQKKHFRALFHGWDSTVSSLEPLWGTSLLFTIVKFLKIAGTHFLSTWTRTNNTNTEIWSKERSIGPHVAKMLFLQVDEGFWLYYNSAWYKNI